MFYNQKAKSGLYNASLCGHKRFMIMVKASAETTHLSKAPMEDDKPASQVREEASTSKPKIQSSDAHRNLAQTDSIGNISSPDSEVVDMELEELPTRTKPNIIVHRDEVIVSPTNSNGRTENIVDIHEMLEAAEQASRPAKALRTYNGIRKDNKDELGRCLDFLEKNMINLRFRISDKEYVISSCNVTIKPVKKSTNNDEEVMNIKKDDMSCENPVVNKFMKESVYSYREKITKESKSGKETEVIRSPSPPDCDSIERYKTPSPNISYGYMSHRREYELREINSHLLQKINYDRKHPFIKNMLTVPISIGESSVVRAYVFVSLTGSSITMHYYSKDTALNQILQETKSTFAYFTYTMLNSVHVNMLLSYEKVGNEIPSVDITEYVHKKTFGWPAYGIKVKTHECECLCGKTIKSQPEAVPKPQPKPPVEELKETKPITVMVDCDNCGKMYKESTNHKCQRSKKTKPQQEVHPCHECDRVFSRKAHLSNHLRSHKEYMKSTVKCSLCNTRIPKGEFKKHKAEWHPEIVNDFSCNECGKIMLSEYKLIKHMKVIHGIEDSPQENNIKCEKCNMTFPISYYINEHEKECNPESPQSGNSEVTVHNSSEESADYTRPQVLEDHKGTSIKSPENSKTTDSAPATMKKFTAIRSTKNITDPDTYYTDVYVTEGYESDNDLYKVLRPRKGKRYSELSTSESESEEPQRKKRKRYHSTGAESYYVGQEELRDPIQDDASIVLNGQAATSVEEGETNEVVFSECEDNTMPNHQEVDSDDNLSSMEDFLDQISFGNNDRSEGSEVNEEGPNDDCMSPEELDQLIEEAAINELANGRINEVNNIIGENRVHSEAENNNGHRDTSGGDVGVPSIQEQKDNVNESNTNIMENNTMQVEESSLPNSSYQQSTNTVYVTNTTSNENASVIKLIPG